MRNTLQKNSSSCQLQDSKAQQRPSRSNNNLRRIVQSSFNSSIVRLPSIYRSTHMDERPLSQELRHQQVLISIW